ncbi:MAG TPA: SGNH/GDSL hydrolase family protein [Candidatus Saccharimonadales bacterium]|nr:SGNH/GDSL hydrolase family protein [Candidatus Saccharimonadales bacterium]
MKKRFFWSLSLSLLATLMGLVLSLSPAIAIAHGSNRYVALGDSIAAGVGLQPLEGSQEDAVCGRSSASYPYQVARRIGMSFGHYACGGAKVSDGLYDSQEIGGLQLEPQIDRAFAAGTPEVISVTIGANDMRWTRILQQCYLSDCGGRLDEVQMTAYRTYLRYKLHRTLSLIYAKSHEVQPKVIFTGYFMPFSTGAPACADTRNFTPTEMTWLNGQVAKLNQTITDSVSWYDFARYAPVDFAGHEFCTQNPWIQGVADPAPYHPTAAGQLAISRSVLAEYSR